MRTILRSNTYTGINVPMHDTPRVAVIDGGCQLFEEVVHFGLGDFLTIANTCPQFTATQRFHHQVVEIAVNTRTYRFHDVRMALADVKHFALSKPKASRSVFEHIAFAPFVEFHRKLALNFFFILFLVHTP